jgi:hypothetical protein
MVVPTIAVTILNAIFVYIYMRVIVEHYKQYTGVHGLFGVPVHQKLNPFGFNSIDSTVAICLLIELRNIRFV